PGWMGAVAAGAHAGVAPAEPGRAAGRKANGARKAMTARRRRRIWGETTPMALPYDRRPVDDTPLHTEDLPPTPQRDRTIPTASCTTASARGRRPCATRE